MRLIRILRYGLILTVLILLNGTLILRAQTTSNSGTEFWVVFPTHEADFDPQTYSILHANLSIFITSTQASSGRVSVGSFSEAFNVTAGNVIEVQVPRSLAYVDIADANKVLTNKAIHVVIDPGKPKVVVYAHIFAGQRSAATLVLPKQALGQQYFSVNYPQLNAEGKNYIAIAAAEPNTKVHIKRGNIELVAGGITLNQANDVYEYVSDDDLTGVSVTVDPTSSCNRFAMFCGSTGVRIGKNACNPSSLDPLFQQAYAIENWGTIYGFIPFSTYSPNRNEQVRTAGQYAGIIARDNDTHVKINGLDVATLNAGQYYFTPNPITEVSAIVADKPICVAQYALSQGCSNFDLAPPAVKAYSDPDMVILNPVNYSTKDVTMYSSSREDVVEQYINILIKSAAASSFRVNDSIPPTAFKPLPGLPGYSYLQLSLTSYASNTFRLHADDGFNATAYGFGNVESYAYSAGTNLASEHAISGIDKITQNTVDMACVNDDYEFKLTLPYKAANISWQMDATETPTVQINPVPVSKSDNGKIVYEYSFPKTAAYINPGLHQITVLAAFPQIGSCNAGVEAIDYVFEVKPVPELNISNSAESCANIINFKAQLLNNADVDHWQWDFGDPGFGNNTSDTQDTRHVYVNGGVYNVTLTAFEKNGCKTVKTHTITIAPSASFPHITFSPMNAVCITDPPFSLSASETTGVAGNGLYHGQGVSPAGLFNPALAGEGVHNIKYEFAALNGCVNSQTQSIEVLPAPYAADTVFYTTAGKPLSLKPNYSTGNFSYRWSPAEGLSSATVAEPKATLNQSTTYLLTVYNSTCSSTATIKVEVLKLPVAVNTFTPNGDGVNDSWHISHIIDFPKATIDVFNRYGVRVFSSIGYAKPWDGSMNGKPVPAGVYYYKLDLGANLKPISGSVTVLR